METDLLSALDSGQLSGAMLDVFSHEPLPENHEFWSHPRIIVTPHIAAQSLAEESAMQIAGSVAAVNEGNIPAGWVDRKRGY